MDILEVRHTIGKDNPGGHCGGKGDVGSLGDVAANTKESSPPFISHCMVLEHLIPGLTLSSIYYGLEKQKDKHNSGWLCSVVEHQSGSRTCILIAGGNQCVLCQCFFLSLHLSPPSFQLFLEIIGEKNIIR